MKTQRRRSVENGGTFCGNILPIGEKMFMMDR